MKICLNENIFDIVRDVSSDLKTPAYVIGGYVRDLVLNRPSKDIDIVVQGNGIQFARKVASTLGKKIPVSVFKNFGTAMIRWGEHEIEFVGARKESYRSNSRKPMVQPGTLEDDQWRRDFTINALSISLNEDSFGELIDPFNGQKDLEAKIIRTPLEPGSTFSDDPLRMLRAVRFSTQLRFHIEEKTFKAIAENKERINIISGERISDELNKIMLSEKPSAGFKLLDKCGLLQIILPEISALKGIDIQEGQGHKDNFFHSLKVLDNVTKRSENLWLRWTALLHDIAKPATKKFIQGQGWTFHGHEYLGSKMIPSVFRRLKLPLNEKMKYVQKLVALHLRPIALAEEEITDSAVRRLLFEAGDDIDDLMLLAEADITSKNEYKVKQYLANLKGVRNKLVEIEEKDAIRNFQPPVSGELIMETFNIPPCKTVGDIKNRIKEAILDGVIRNDYAEAHQYMLNIAREMGLDPVK